MSYDSDAWMRQAACRTQPVDVFFPDPGVNPHQAKTVCRACPVLHDCLTTALTATPAVQGVWGGTTFKERRALRRTAA